jgi:hypothetical protein
MQPSPEQILKRAVDQITAGIGAGTTPQEAVVKVARESGLGPGFIKRACEVVNVALTFEHFRKNASARDQEFPLVDAAAAVREVYGKEAPTTGEKRAEQFPGLRVRAVDGGLRRLHDSPAHRKVAMELLALEPDGPCQPTPQGIAERTNHVRQRLTKVAADALVDLEQCRENVRRKFAALADAWQRDPDARSTFVDFESQAFAAHGARAVPYLDLLHKSSAAKEPRGDHDPDLRFFTKSAEARQFDDLLDAVDRLAFAARKEAEAVREMADFETARREVFQKVAQMKLAGFREQVTSLRDGLPAEADGEDPEDPVELAAVKRAAEHATRILPPVDTLIPKPSLPEKPSKPPAWAIDAPYQTLDRKLMIQNLILTDPLLRTYPPAEVLQAYRQFMRLAPELSLEPAITKSQLRAMVSGDSGVLDPFTAKSLVDTASTIRKYRDPGKGDKEEKGEDAGAPTTIFNVGTPKAK